MRVLARRSGGSRWSGLWVAASLACDAAAVADPLEELLSALWVLAALGRVAGRGLLGRPAPAGDRLDVVSQRLLVEAGWLEPDSLRPSERWTSVMPPGAPPTALSGVVTEFLTTALRYVRGAPPGWVADDPELIRWRSKASGGVIGALITDVLTDLPAVAQRLDEAGATFLDVGVGGAGISIALCRQHPQLRVVGVDVNPAALAVAREDVAAAGLEARIELRQQSVADIDDVKTFDLIWLSQSFFPHEVLIRALPALRRAVRPHAALLMLTATPSEAGVVGTSTELGHLVTGGGTMTAADARALLDRSGWVEVTTKPALGGVLALARSPG